MHGRKGVAGIKLDSLSFIYLFLPISLLLSWVTPTRRRAGMLLALSIFFYAVTEGAWVLLAIGVVLSDWILARIVSQPADQNRLRYAALMTAIVKDVGLIAGFQIASQVWSFSTPLGLQVFALISLGYVIDCYYREIYWERSPVVLLLMCLFYPAQYAGPIVYYARVTPLMTRPRMSLDKIAESGGVFLRGLAKKVVLGDGLREVLIALYQLPGGQLTTLTAWTMQVILLLTLYFILSGYCDMARGLGGMFGFELPENYHEPFLAKSVNEFMARFNATVSRFMRRYIYVHLGGAQGGFWSVAFNILLVSVLVGLWFGLRLNLVVWGICLAFFVLAERYVLPGFLKNGPSLFRWMYCMGAVLLSMPFFGGESLGQSADHLAAMFGLGEVPGFNTEVLYLLASNYVICVAAVLCASGLFHQLEKLLQARLPRFSVVAGMFVNAGLLVLVTIFLF